LSAAHGGGGSSRTPLTHPHDGSGHRDAGGRLSPSSYACMPQPPPSHLLEWRDERKDVRRDEGEQTARPRGGTCTYNNNNNNEQQRQQQRRTTTTTTSHLHSVALVIWRVRQQPNEVSLIEN
jgi:hypothetical protein